MCSDKYPYPCQNYPGHPMGSMQRVKRKKGCGGVDGQSIVSIVDEHGEKKFLNEH